MIHLSFYEFCVFIVLLYCIYVEVLLAKALSGKSTCLLQVFVSAEPSWLLGKTGVCALPGE